MLSKKFLYKDINNDLFKILSKKDNKYYIQDVNNGTKFYSSEIAFESLFKLTNIEVEKYEKNLIV